LRGCFVTGTDTGVGKTVLAAAIVASLRERGVEASGLKPVLTGLDEPAASGWPADHELLAAVSGRTPGDVVVAGYGPPVSPHLAAELAGRPLGLAALRDATRAAADTAEVTVVEGVGGLLVPLDDAFLLRDLARELGLPLVIAARPGLGTINHTLLTLESARYAGLEVAGVVLTPWPERPDEIERSNHLTIARLGDVEVRTLERVAAPQPRLLAQAARGLPLERWLR
jgi:dethiobiotin synthetase